SLVALMPGISLCASGIIVLSKVAKPLQMKPRGLGSTEEPLGSFACAPSVRPTLPPQDSCTFEALYVETIAPVRRRATRPTAQVPGSLVHPPVVSRPTTLTRPGDPHRRSDNARRVTMRTPFFNKSRLTVRRHEQHDRAQPDSHRRP